MENNSKKMLEDCVFDTQTLFSERAKLIKKGKVRDVYEIEDSSGICYYFNSFTNDCQIC